MGITSLPNRKARRGRSRAGNRGVKSSLLREAVNSLAVLALGRLDLQPHLLAQGAADEAAYRMGLPAGGFHDLLQGGTVGPFQQFHDRGSLAALPGATSTG